MNATSLARIVSLDPGLTVRLLKMVNSPFYGFPTRIDTVSHAVTVVGFEQLKQLALATTVVRMFRSMPEHLAAWAHLVKILNVQKGVAHLLGVQIQSTSMEPHQN